MQGSSAGRSTLSITVGWWAGCATTWLETLAALPQEQVPSPEVQTSLLQSLHEVDAMLDGLAPRIRQAFLLAQLEGCTYAQIAERLGISVRTVKRYMAEAYEQCIMLTL